MSTTPVPKKPPQLSDFRILGERRCCNRLCGQLLPENAPAEAGAQGRWIVALCKNCLRWTPFRLEATA